MSEDSLSLRTFILGDPPNAALSQCVASVTAALGTSLFDVRHFDWSSLAADDETISLPMADHHVETSLKPCLEITVGERPPVRITFEIACELELKGLVVKVQNACIREL